jgi:hypothetical protein
MPSEYETAIANEARQAFIGKTAPENSAAYLERGVNGNNYIQDRKYEGGESIADAVKGAVKGKDPIDLYSKPVKSMRENNPNKDIYASLLNYEFMN